MNFRYLKLIAGWQMLLNFSDIPNIFELTPSWDFGTPIIGSIKLN